MGDAGQAKLYISSIPVRKIGLTISCSINSKWSELSIFFILIKLPVNRLSMQTTLQPKSISFQLFFY